LDGSYFTTLFATKLEQSLSTIRFYLNREVINYAAAQNCYPDHQQGFSGG
jgi:hypothetical protein